MPDLAQALEAFGTPGGTSIADEVQKFLERLGVASESATGAIQAIQQAETGVMNQMGPMVPEAVSVGQKMLKEQLEQMLGRAGSQKKAIPSALEKIYGSGAVEGLDRALYEERQRGIATSIGGMFGGEDTAERRAKVKALMETGVFGEYIPPVLGTLAQTEAERRELREARAPRYTDSGELIPTSGSTRVQTAGGNVATIQVMLDPDGLAEIILPAAVTKLKLQGIRPT